MSFQQATDQVARIFSCVLFGSLQISDRPFGAFLTGRYKNERSLEDQRTTYSPSPNTTESCDTKYLPCDPGCYPSRSQPVVMPQGRNSWLPPLAFQKPMTRAQSMHSSRPLLMRSQTDATSSSSVYSGSQPPSETTRGRHPSITSSMSKLSYSSTVQPPGPSEMQSNSEYKLPAMPERYRRHPGRCSDTVGGVPHDARSKATMPPAAYWRQATLQNAPKASQEEIHFWQGNSGLYWSDSLRSQYPVSFSSSTRTILPELSRAPTLGKSKVEKRKRSYESLRKGKISIHDGTLVPTNFGGLSKFQNRRMSVPENYDKGEPAGAGEVARRQSRTLVKKRQPWDSAPRSDRRSRV